MTEKPPAPTVSLRVVEDADLPVFFEHQRDPESLRMAAFKSRDESAFMAHWQHIRKDPTMMVRTIVAGGVVVGNVGSWQGRAERLVGYWIDRRYWGRGIASAALDAFLREDSSRPLHAFVAASNVGSIRVLEKCGFVRVAEHLDGDVPEHEYVLR